MSTKNSFIIETLILPKEALSALKEILTSPRLILSILPQYVAGLGGGYIIYHLVLESLTPILSAYLSFELTNWPGFIVTSINWLAGGIATGISVVIAGMSSIIGGYLAILLLTGFFVELFIEQALKTRGLAPVHAPSFFGGLIRLIKDESLKLIMLGTLGVISIVTAFIPVLSPISIILGATIIGFELFDQPLILLGLRFGERLKLFGKHLLVILALGGAFSLTAIIPFLPILLLPVGSLTALRTSTSWNEIVAIKASATPVVQH
jgi:uncharacterized protein involved in cysteine biosynthesis